MCCVCVCVCDWKCLMPRMKNNFVARARLWSHISHTVSETNMVPARTPYSPIPFAGENGKTYKFIQQWNEPHNWIKYYACIFLYAKLDRRRWSIPLSLTMDSVGVARRACECIWSRIGIEVNVVRTMNGNASIVYIRPTMHGLRFDDSGLHDLNVQRPT